MKVICGSVFLFSLFFQVVLGDYFSSSSGNPNLRTTKVYTVVSGTHLATAESTVSKTITTTKGLPTNAYYNCVPSKYIQSDIPMCAPNQGDRWVKGRKYKVSWDPLYFGVDNLLMVVSYLNDSGLIAATKKVQNSKGEIMLKANKGWLHDDSFQNVTIDLVTISENNMTLLTGPRILLAKDLDSATAAAENAAFYGPRRNIKAAIAVPSVILGLILVALVYYAYRKDTWKIYMAKIRIRRSAPGYGVRRSRRQRMQSRPVAYTSLPADAHFEDSDDEDYYQSQVKKFH
ncbi:membrane trafficking protein, ER to Golgi Psg2 [Schizosaccharomyces pombe]|uniref:Uncharacterized membrane protein P31B10.04 n=1 Tax=Schizosaccharomyces pombe (strain 972 / ATCC 24843) TaxID=284812 RepID=YJH4_SCHPO|nr:uncharacterized protein SPCP31B10.04 [Schizosaccharomyces pombe]Q9USH0.1 RecName: Full=Uncharacterized membrane protein P31B10.04; Flags: Precursor [Schizosaccharomyces pombe 972h-]CAB58370.1 conserved fungal protein [Schizosaccharomyces pombe]|eukprot:NP_587860.1 uncharacterized protein SPCP31B10.04 [Schizosaccharomyces pombe]